MSSRLRRSQQIKIVCKKCGAKKGQLCRSASGNPLYDFHAVRNYEAGIIHNYYIRRTRDMAKD